MQWLEERFLFFYEVYHILFVDRLTVDADALTEVHKVW